MSDYTWQRQTMHETLARIQQDPEYTWVAIGDFLDDWRRSAEDDRLALVSMGIPEVEIGSSVFHWAVFCAAMVEWLCIQDHFSIPDWTQDSHLHLPDPWYLYPGEVEQMKAWQRETTPASFAQRNIFGGDKILSRI